ncbi:hypothetical protein GQX74_010586, partial [Glossina fuscipes]
KVYCTTRKYTVRPEKYSIRPEKYTVRPEKYIIRPESILYDQKNEVRINHNLIKPYNVADIKPFVEQLFEEMNAQWIQWSPPLNYYIVFHHLYQLISKDAVIVSEGAKTMG